MNAITIVFVCAAAGSLAGCGTNAALPPADPPAVVQPVAHAMPMPPAPPSWTKVVPADADGRSFFLGSAQGNRYAEDRDAFSQAELRAKTEAISRIWTSVEGMIEEEASATQSSGSTSERGSMMMRLKSATAGDLVTSRREREFHDKSSGMHYVLVSVEERELSPSRGFLTQKHEQLFTSRRSRGDFESALGHLEILAALDRTPRRMGDIVGYLEQMQWWQQAALSARLLVAEFAGSPEAEAAARKLPVLEEQARLNPDAAGAKPKVRGVKVGIMYLVAGADGAEAAKRAAEGALARLRAEGIDCGNVAGELGAVALGDMLEYPGVARGRLPDEFTHLALAAVFVRDFDGEPKAVALAALLDLNRAEVLEQWRPALPVAKGADAARAADNGAAATAHEIGRMAARHLRK